jgi:hypothetical protein
MVDAGAGSQASRRSVSAIDCLLEGLRLKRVVVCPLLHRKKLLVSAFLALAAAGLTIGLIAAFKPDAFNKKKSPSNQVRCELTCWLGASAGTGC